MWFFLMTGQHGYATVGPFKSEAQCREAQAAVQEAGRLILLPCWRGQ